MSDWKVILSVLFKCCWWFHCKILSLSPRTALIVSLKNTKSQYPYQFARFTCIYHHFPSVFALTDNTDFCGTSCSPYLTNTNVLSSFITGTGTLSIFKKFKSHTSAFQIKSSGYFQHVQLKHYIFPLADITNTN